MQEHVTLLDGVEEIIRVAQRRHVLRREGFIAPLTAVIVGGELGHVTQEQRAAHGVHVALRVDV